MQTIDERNVPCQGKLIGLYGAGGFAREVMPLVSDYVSKATGGASSSCYQACFIETEPQQREINGYPVVSEQAFMETKHSERFFNIAIGNSKIRERLAGLCLAQNIKPLSLLSPHAVVYDNNEIGEGAIICAFSTITSNARIGKFFHSNIYLYVAHDCVIGNYVTFAPNVHCNGNVHIHDHAYIGTGAIIKQGSASSPLVIGEGAVVGMGAVVTKDVPPYTVVVGNPARQLSKN